MATSEKELRTCSNGHTYDKSSACPTCPTCEQENKPDSGSLTAVSTSKKGTKA